MSGGDDSHCIFCRDASYLYYLGSARLQVSVVIFTRPCFFLKDIATLRNYFLDSPRSIDGNFSRIVGVASAAGVEANRVSPINIRTLRSLHRKNAGICIYSGILFDNCVFRFQTFRDVISGKSRDVAFLPLTADPAIAFL
jgi:hypothetical protein